MKVVSMKNPGVLAIDRTEPFRHEFTWSIEEEDTDALTLTEIDFSKVLLTACLNEGETSITGRERLRRHLAESHIRLDAKIGTALLEEKGRATRNYLYHTLGVSWVEFPGTTLRSPAGERGFLCVIRWDGLDDMWGSGIRLLDDVRYSEDVSAVLGK